MIKDWGFGEKNWHLEIRNLQKCYLVNLVEDIKVKYQLSDSDMNELVINLKNPLDKRVSG